MADNRHLNKERVKMKSKNKQILMWILVIVYASTMIIFSIDEKYAMIRIFCTVICFTVFAIIHGIERYGVKSVIFFFFIASVISILYENLSVITGFPFGNYYYSDLLGPKIGHAPIFLIGYFGFCYLSWSLAGAILNKYKNHLTKSDVIILPIVATFIAVMFDYVMDPYAATVLGAYIWEDGGSYFGVPFSNFMGWYLCIYTIIQVFAVYEYFRRRTSEPEIMKKKTFWLQTTLTYLIGAIQMPMLAIFGDNTTVISETGQIYNTIEIYQVLTLVGITTMLFVTLLGVINIFGSKELEW